MSKEMKNPTLAETIRTLKLLEYLDKLRAASQKLLTRRRSERNPHKARRVASEIRRVRKELR